MHLCSDWQACDVSNAASVQKLASGLKNVKGLLHLAAVLDDATLPKLTRAHLDKAFGAKDALDFTVLFSSTSALLGSPGQGNYTAANASLDAHAFVWQQAGERAWSVQWGPWREVFNAKRETCQEETKQSLLAMLQFRLRHWLDKRVHLSLS
eukprot:724722-Amphidinium_carterae.2